MSVSIKVVDVKAATATPRPALVKRLSAPRPNSAPVAERLVASAKARAAVLEARASKASVSTARGKAVCETKAHQAEERSATLQRKMEASAEKRERVLKQAQFRALDSVARAKAAAHKKDLLVERRASSLSESLALKLERAQARRSEELEKRVQHARADLERHQTVLERLHGSDDAQLATSSSAASTPTKRSNSNFRVNTDAFDVVNAIHSAPASPTNASPAAARSSAAALAFEKARHHNEHAAEVKRKAEAKFQEMTSPAKLEARLQSAAEKREANLSSIVGKARDAELQRSSKRQTLVESFKAQAHAAALALEERLSDAAHRRSFYLKTASGASSNHRALLMAGC